MSTSTAFILEALLRHLNLRKTPLFLLSLVYDFTSSSSSFSHHGPPLPLLLPGRIALVRSRRARKRLRALYFAPSPAVPPPSPPPSTPSPPPSTPSPPPSTPSPPPSTPSPPPSTPSPPPSAPSPPPSAPSPPPSAPSPAPLPTPPLSPLPASESLHDLRETWRRALLETPTARALLANLAVGDDSAAERLLRAQGRFLVAASRPSVPRQRGLGRALAFFARLALAPDRYVWSTRLLLELETLMPRDGDSSNRPGLQRRGMVAFALSVLSATERLLVDPSARDALEALDVLSERLARARGVMDFVGVIRGAASVFFEWVGAKPLPFTPLRQEEHDLDAIDELTDWAEIRARDVLPEILSHELDLLRAGIDASLNLPDARSALDDMDYARVRWLGLIVHRDVHSEEMRLVRRDVEFLLHSMVPGSLSNYGIERRDASWEPAQKPLPPWELDELRMATTLRVRVVFSSRQTTTTTTTERDDPIAMENALETIAADLPLPRLELFQHLGRYLEREYEALRDATSARQKQFVTDRTSATLRRLSEAQLSMLPARAPVPLEDPYELYENEVGSLDPRQQQGRLRTHLTANVSGMHYQPKPLRTELKSLPEDDIRLRTLGLYEAAVPLSRRVPPHAGFEETDAQRDAFTRVSRVRVSGQWIVAHVIDTLTKRRQKIRMSTMRELRGLFLSRPVYSPDERRMFLRALEEQLTVGPLTTIEERDAQQLHSLKTRGATALFVSRLVSYAKDSVSRQYAFALPIVHDAFSSSSRALGVLPGVIPVSGEVAKQQPDLVQQPELSPEMSRVKNVRLTVRLVRDLTSDGRVAAVGYALSYPEAGIRKRLLFSYVQLAKTKGWRAGMLRVRVDPRELMRNANRDSNLVPSETLATHQFLWIEEARLWISQRWEGQELRLSVLTREGTALNELEAQRSAEKTRELLRGFLSRSKRFREREPENESESSVRSASVLYTRRVFDVEPRPLPREAWENVSRLVKRSGDGQLDEEYLGDAQFLAWAGTEHAVRDIQPPWLARWLDANADVSSELADIAASLKPARLEAELGAGLRPLELIDGYTEAGAESAMLSPPTRVMDRSVDALLGIAYVRRVSALLLRDGEIEDDAPLRLVVGLCDELLANGYLELALQDLVGVVVSALGEDDARREWLTDALELVLERASDEALFLGSVACAAYLSSQMSLLEHSLVYRLGRLRREHEEVDVLRSLHDRVSMARSVLDVHIGNLEGMVIEESEQRERQQLRFMRGGPQDFESEEMLQETLRLASAAAQDPDSAIVNPREAAVVARTIDPGEGLRGVSRYLDFLREEALEILSHAIK